MTEYVTAELDRRYPVRLLMRSGEPADLRAAWRQLDADWEATIARIRQGRRLKRQELARTNGGN